jgi:hypothetical protein
VTSTEEYIEKLTGMKFGELGQLRTHAGQGLDAAVDGFDLFTGLWWPLREKNQAAPRREIAWLIAKLYAAFPIRHEPCKSGGLTALAVILGREERSLPGQARLHFRQRFDSLLCTSLSDLEPHLRWALSAARHAVIAGRSQGIDWVQLTDHVSIWDCGEEHRLARDIREIWAEHYLKVFKIIGGKKESPC